MKKRFAFVALIVVAWIAVPAIGAHILFGQSPVAHQIRPTKLHPEFSTTQQGSIGNEREQAVIAATKRYVAEHPDAPKAMAEGKELAPVGALNAELAAKDAKFRVRAVKGAKAQFYEVS